MAKSKKQVLTDEEKNEIYYQSELRDLKKRIDLGLIPKPTRFFNIGDAVKIGNLENITVTDVLFEGYAYKIFYDYMGEAYGRPDRKTGTGIWDWTSIFPVTSFTSKEVIRVKDDIQIRYYNNDIDSLLHKVYHSGIDFNPNYQRDLVWTLEQKISLLDSIFNNVEIGKFTFIRHDYKRDLYYEILDGKQRLSTICEFYEDRIEYKGKKFSELSFLDAYHFRSFPIIQGEVGEITEQQILRLFIKMNTCGLPMQKEHLEKVKSMIK